jgi:single-strand DNA-binding protein
MINKVFLVGRVGRKDVRITENTTVAVIRLATDRWNKKSQEVETDWHRVVMFGKLAENADKILEKGDAIAIVGSLRYSIYNENKRASVMAETFKLVSKKKKQEDQPPEETDFQDNEQFDFEEKSDQEEDYDDIPF